jgi:hypothetical protein
LGAKLMAICLERNKLSGFLNKKEAESPASS